ncbi:MAG: MarR family transcriptional regulator [Ignavibacteria bacterium]
MDSNYQKAQAFAELICELTRNCNIKEDFFASSFNLSTAEVKLLKLFAFSDTLTIKELCSMLNLSPGRITQILASLEKKNLITRTADTADKRNIIVSIAPKCSPFIMNLHNSYIDLHRKILENVPPEEYEKIYSSLDILVGLFRNWVNEK